MPAYIQQQLDPNYKQIIITCMGENVICHFFPSCKILYNLISLIYMVAEKDLYISSFQKSINTPKLFLKTIHLCF